MIAGITIFLRRVGLCTAAVVAAVICNSLAISAEPTKKSGYAIGPERCGSGSLSFPRLKIDMKEGFCAGIVASEDDGLEFPRSIVQIPGHEQFVISDMGEWNRKDG